MTHQSILRRAVLCAAAALALLSTPAVAGTETTTTGGVLPLHRGLYYSDAQLAAVRDAVEKEPWRVEMRDRITSVADSWLARSDGEIRALLPKPGALFSHGKTGCPKCMAKWGSNGSDTCSLDRPGKLLCPKCKTMFPDDDPAGRYHDAGRGVEVEGRRHHLTAVWNSFVVNTMYAAEGADNAGVSSLALAYALTGREEYARKAVVMMDALATLAPTTLGPRDYDTGARDSDQGRFQFFTSTVYRAMIPMARNIDLVGGHPMMRADSPTNPGTTVFDNIRKGLYEDYLFRHNDVRGARMSSLHNHEADSIRAMLAAGLLFDNADYIRWGMQCFDALLENTVDRDGMYYETSMGYALFTRSVFADMADLLANYRPEKYAGKTGDFPPARNYFDHPKLQKLVVDNFDLDVMGRRVSFANSNGDDLVLDRNPDTFNTWQLGWLGRVGKHTSNAALRAHIDRMMAAGIALDLPDPAGPRWWLLNRADPLPAHTGKTAEFNMFRDGRFFSTKGLAGFQFGEWPHKKAFLVRGGPNLPHSHDDNLGLNLYDLGRDLSAEIGYGTYGTAVHLGWANRAVSHNLVTVDGDRAVTGQGIYKRTPGAAWRGFLNGEIVKYLDADGAAQFEGTSVTVEKYRRRMLGVVVDDAHAYYLDLFDVKSGSSRDYVLHAPDHDTLLTGALTLDNLRPAPVEGAWTLAGLDPEFRDAPWNAPGRSWGERVGPGETIRPVDPPDGSKGYGWEPPGRGYGFLYNLRGERTDKPWSATWKLRGDDGAHLRASFFPAAPMLACTANAPDRLNEKLYNYVVCRDEGDNQSRFVVLLEPFRGRRAVSDVAVLKNGRTGAVVLKVELANGSTDHIVLGESADELVDFGAGSAAAEMAFLRVDKAGKPVHAAMMRGRVLESGDAELLNTRPAAVTRVSAVDLADGTFVVDTAELRRSGLKGTDPADYRETCGGFALGSAGVAGGTARAFAPVVSTRGASCPTNTLMELRSCGSTPGMMLTQEGDLVVNAGGVALQQFRVDAFDADKRIVTSSIPLPLGFVNGRSTRALDGRAIADTDGKVVGRVASSPGLSQVEVAPGTTLENGRLYWVMDIVAGHDAEFPVAATWDADK